jgi:hypothetical protein
VRITEKIDFDNVLLITDELRKKIREISLEFVNKVQDSRNACVACGYSEYSYGFEKSGFHYVQCQRCSTLYIKNPLSKDQLERYRGKVKEIYKEDRVKEIFKNWFSKKIFDLEITINRLFSDTKGVKIGFLDIKYAGIINDLKEKFPGSEVREIDLKEDHKYHLIIMDNLLERLVNPKEYLKTINPFLEKEGYLYVTSRLGSGIDILMLWENSNLIPTEHLNLLTKEGVDYLFSELFHLKYISTPGVLDLKVMLASENPDLPPFLSYLKKHRGDEIIEDFQYFLQKNLLSSYMIMLAQKKE